MLAFFPPLFASITEEAKCITYKHYTTENPDLGFYHFYQRGQQHHVTALYDLDSLTQGKVGKYI